MTYKEAERQMFRETFKLDEVHEMMKKGQKQQAMPIIEEGIKAITDGKNLHHRAHYSFNEAKAIEDELRKLKAVGQGEMRYEEAFGEKKKAAQQKANPFKQDIPQGQIGHGYNVNPLPYSLGHGY